MQVIAYRKDIDALRGVSVILVVFFHAFPNIIPGGFIGVDVFFVISGYLITRIIITSVYNDKFSLLEFYSRRIRRLFPALITVLIVSMLVGWLVLFPDEYERLASHVKYSAIYVLNFILIGETGYFDVESVYKPLLHLWTLSVEEQYYIVWPLILLICLKQSLIKPVYIISFVAISSFIANIYFVEDYSENVYFNTLTRMWQLALGSLLAVSLGAEIKERKHLWFLGMALILSAALLIDDETVYPGWAALLPSIGAILIIVANSKFQRWGGMVSVGLISYPLYLWHWLVISFLYIYLGRNPDTILMIVVIIISFILAYLTHIYIERLRYAKGAFITITLLLSLASIGLAGAYVNNKDGLPERGHLSYLDKYNIEFKRTEMVDDQCSGYSKTFLHGERLFDYCRADNLNENKYIAIIGDSHAHAIYPGISEQSQQMGYGTILMANSSCPPLIGFEWGNNPVEVEQCKKKIKQILSIIDAEKKIEKVFIATRGPVYIHGEVEGDFTPDSVDSSLRLIRQEKLTYQAYSDGFKNTLDKLHKKTHIKAIYYFLENPELDFQPKEIVPRPFDIWDVSTNAGSVDRDLYLLRMGIYREMMLSYAGKYKKLVIIDPMPYLCDLERCYSYRDGNYLYADDDHFSVFGSRYIARRINGAIFDGNR